MVDAQEEHRIHPNFDFSPANLDERLTGLPETARENPEEFLNLAEKMLDTAPEFLILVDKEHPLPSDFAPRTLSKLTDFPELTVSRNDLTLDDRILGQLLLLTRAARIDGVQLPVSSAYRSYEYQEAVFHRNVREYGESAALRFSAPPGCSQHQLGTTVDFGSITNDFATSPAGIWVAANAGSFGWSLSYPEGLEEETGYVWESWHWRWIGPAATAIQKQYFGDVQQRLLTFWNENASRIREAYIQSSERTS